MYLKFFFSAIFGAAQGITEFLPISSSGHLIILHKFSNLDVDNLIFDVALHLGSLLALFIYFRKKIYSLFSVFGKADKQQDKSKKNLRLFFFIFFATIPAGLIGFFFEDAIESYFRNITVVSLTLIIGGILLIIVDKYSKKQKDIYSLSATEIFLIGIAQAFALIPGVSRSATTIIAGLGLKLQRKAAAEFSFLLAIPIIFGAVAKKMFDLNLAILSTLDKLIFLIGILSSFVVSYLVIKYFIKFLEKHSLVWFGWYRILLGFIILLWMFI
ncbi:MAG: undecaprenyl-diphosphatase UppP [bacterium]